MLDAMGVEHRLPVAQLAVGDQFVVRPGETVATDGEVVFGHSAIDRSAMTGESVPVDVVPGDDVVGGTMSVGGRSVVQATKVGRDTQLAHMVRLVENAQNEKAAVQRLADRIAGVFVPAVLVIALVTLGCLAVGRWLYPASLQRRAIGSDHRLPLRTGSGDSDGPARRVGPGCSPRDLLQGLPSTGGFSTDRHGRARQDRDGHRREDGGHRRGGSTRDRASHAPALGGGARTGVGAPRRPGHRRFRTSGAGHPASGSPVRGTAGCRCSREPSTDIGSRSGKSTSLPLAHVRCPRTWLPVARHGNHSVAPSCSSGERTPSSELWPSPTRSDPRPHQRSRGSRHLGSTASFCRETTSQRLEPWAIRSALPTWWPTPCPLTRSL